MQCVDYADSAVVLRFPRNRANQLGELLLMDSWARPIRAGNAQSSNSNGSRTFWISAAMQVIDFSMIRLVWIRFGVGCRATLEILHTVRRAFFPCQADI